MGTHVNLYNSFLAYCRELAPGTVSLTGDRAQGDDSKHDSQYTFCWTRAQILLLDFDINNTLLRKCILRPCYKSKKEFRDQESIQSPHLTQDTNAKVTTSQLDITNESLEVSPFPAGDHKASINRRARKHIKNKTEIAQIIHKRSTALKRSVKTFYDGRGWGGLNPVSQRANFTLSSDVDHDT